MLAHLDMYRKVPLNGCDTSYIVAERSIINRLSLIVDTRIHHLDYGAHNSNKNRWMIALIFITIGHKILVRPYVRYT